MNPGRTFRTVRHLTAEQWIFRAVCRGRWTFARRFPRAFRARIERTVRCLPRPRSDTPALVRAARHVLALQSAVHGAHLDGIPEGRFHFLGRTIAFGSLARIEWRRDLGERNNPLWRMNLSYMGWLVPLLAGARPGSLGLARDVLAGMDRQNTWSQPGVFRDVWHPYSVSHRLINLLAGLALHREAGGASDPEAEAALLDHARLCAAFLLHNLERDLQYNHLLKNFVALSVYRAALAQPLKRLDFLPRAVARSLSQQILPDGGHAERAPMYHALCLIDLEVLEAAGAPLGDHIGLMRRALAAMSHPDGDVALFNDSWIGEAPPASALAGPSPEGRVALPVTGYVRLGGGGDAAILDCGPCGPDANPGHAHADFLSVELSVAGQRFLVDPGVPTYSAGPLRDLCRSAGQHNGPHLAGLEPIEFWQSFRVGRRGYGYPLDDEGFAGFAPLWAAGWQDGYRPWGVTTGRWIGLWPGKAFLVVDRWRGADVRRAALRFLTPWERQANGFARDGAAVRLRVLAGTEPVIEPAQWWPRFGEASPAHAVMLLPRADSNGATAATLWLWGEEPADMPAIAAAAATALAGRLETLR